MKGIFSGNCTLCFFSIDQTSVLVCRVNLHTSKCWKRSDNSNRETTGSVPAFLLIPTKKKLILVFNGQDFCTCYNRFPIQEILPC